MNEEARAEAIASGGRAAALLARAASSAPATVRLKPVPSGRVSGWEAICEVHGAMPVLAPSMAAAAVAAAEHLKRGHNGRGEIVKPSGRRPRARGGRR